MAIRREALVRDQLLTAIRSHPGTESLLAPDGPIIAGSRLTRRSAIAIFEAALQSRLQDLEARNLKDQGLSYYTIGSSGHECNAALGHLLRLTDPAFVHYRSGPFMAARARIADGETPLFDSMLAFTASAEDPVSGGRHKVLGSYSLNVPPQTSTIASHLPKAVGYAYSLARLQRLGLAMPCPADSIVYCSFGDASSNHATALAGFNAAAAAAIHRQPCPILFVCEDNGIGISVRTPEDYIERNFKHRPGMDYFQVDGSDLAATFDTASAAIDHCRSSGRPTFLHLRTVRLMGHAGSDVEANYMTAPEIEANEALDPMLAYVDLLLKNGAIEKEHLLAMHADMEERLRRAGQEAATRPKLSTASEVMAPLSISDSSSIEIPVADPDTRREAFKGRLPEEDGRPRHLAYRIAQGLRDLMLAHEGAFVFGEDVARKGGVYHVTDGLHETFGSGRVFNTILDETTILGLAQGIAQAGCLAIPEIQYLAYIHNALDQIRGEAATLQFFSGGKLSNPMVVRVASFGYQKGFGGHFHNDNSIGALLDIPGLIIACPSRADDAVGMLRTCAANAVQRGKVCLFLEPIALYMQKDLHEAGDDEWQFAYPAPEEAVALGEARVYGDQDVDELTILSFANGLHMSLRAQKVLAAEGISTRVIDLRWLAPLPWEQLFEHAAATGRVLIVDECRHTGGGPSAHILAGLIEHNAALSVRRITSLDSFIPLGTAADTVLLQLEDILEAARAMIKETDR
ncbi:MAG: thiamine pyrophosphate-dependent enzyme [Planctomycetota bacterium]|nr:thiamine pyrophosphate-dependent enzyme [Planctomycetota bacterium]